MTDRPNDLVTLLGGGQLLIGPVGALYVARALAAAERAAGRDGVRPPADFVTLLAAAVRAADQAHAFAPETAKVSWPTDVSTSPGADRWIDPVDVGEVARMLGCSPQWARSLCRRGEFTTAQRRPNGWLVDRGEVVVRTNTTGPHRPPADMEEHHDEADARRPAARRR
jgi:hypothetical protein